MGKNILITGGAGFIGVNTAIHFLKKGDHVYVFDNFSRNGSEKNIKFLLKKYKRNVKIFKGDIRFDFKLLNNLAKKADIIFHFAGQTAVTTSVASPKDDFETNALGTLNVLEAARKSKRDPILIYSSTNKVYGNLEKLKIKKTKTRYELLDFPNGVSENFQLDFHSPYGCSKGTADQYVRDYHRIYGLRTIVFRQSCIYGPFQMGIEDQGWVAWFIIATLNNKKITIFGDGRQVRDILYIDDLIDAYGKAIHKIKTTSGQIYNIGGGPLNSISVSFEYKLILESLFKRKIDFKFAPGRPGDQKIFISDNRKSRKDFGWSPTTNKIDGIKSLYEWLSGNKNK